MNENSEDGCSNDSGRILEGPQRGNLMPLQNGAIGDIPGNTIIDDRDKYLSEGATISGKSFPARPGTDKFVAVPKTYTNHLYRDFTNLPVSPGYRFPTTIDEMTFHERLYHMLNLNSAQRQQTIEWCCHGRAFHILNIDFLEHLGILRCYFNFNTVQRFRKQLNNYGYKLLTRASLHECYYSEFLLLGLPHVLEFAEPSANRRRLLPNPENEPNFDLISALFPLPCDRRALVFEARCRLEAKGCYISDNIFELVVAGRRFDEGK